MDYRRISIGIWSMVVAVFKNNLLQLKPPYAMMA